MKIHQIQQNTTELIYIPPPPPKKLHLGVPNPVWNDCALQNIYIIHVVHFKIRTSRYLQKELLYVHCAKAKFLMTFSVQAYPNLLGTKRLGCWLDLFCARMHTPKLKPMP
jgi:hypothetical protein